MYKSITVGATLLIFTALETTLAQSITNCTNPQFAFFSKSNIFLSFTTVNASGAAAEHQITISISTNGNISGSGKRFDMASNAVSLTSCGGTNVGVLTNSKLGLPIILFTNTDRRTNYMSWNGPIVVTTNITTNQMCYFGVFLSDGARIKGTVIRQIDVSKGWDFNLNKFTTNCSTNTRLSALPTYNGGFSGFTGSASFFSGSGLTP